MVYARQQRAGRARFISALTVSLLAHAWLVHGYGERERARSAVAGVPIEATLIGTSVVRETSMPEPALDALQRIETPLDSPPRILQATPVAQSAAAQRGVENERAMTAPVQVSALPQPQDPTYHASRSLDVFPARLTPLNLAAIRAVMLESGSARATLLIDEAGIVNEVTSVEGAPHTSAEQAIRELFLAARFSPALKDGRVVKSRVLVNLNY